MFTHTIFEILLFKGRSALGTAQRAPGSERVKFSVKRENIVRLLLKFLEKLLPYKLRRFRMAFIFFISFNTFSTGNIENPNF